VNLTDKTAEVLPPGPLRKKGFRYSPLLGIEECPAELLTEIHRFALKAIETGDKKLYVALLDSMPR
jgi:hypothetical protein